MALKIVAFFVLSGVLGIMLHKGFQVWMQRHDRDLRRFAVFSFAFCLLYSFIAEEFFGVADITGAFLAGLIISNTTRATYVSSRVGIFIYAIITIVLCKHRIKGCFTTNELYDCFLYDCHLYCCNLI